MWDIWATQKRIWDLTIDKYTSWNLINKKEVYVLTHIETNNQMEMVHLIEYQQPKVFEFSTIHRLCPSCGTLTLFLRRPQSKHHFSCTSAAFTILYHLSSPTLWLQAWILWPGHEERLSNMGTSTSYGLSWSPSIRMAIWDLRLLVCTGVCHFKYFKPIQLPIVDGYTVSYTTFSHGFPWPPSASKLLAAQTGGSEASRAEERLKLSWKGDRPAKIRGFQMILATNMMRISWEKMMGFNIYIHI